MVATTFLSSVITFLLPLFFRSVTARYAPCTQSFHQLIADKVNISNCKKLGTLGAQWGWKTYEPKERRIDVVFGAKLHENVGWLAWGINPGKKPQMVGTRAIIGIKLLDGSLSINTYNITSDTKLGCALKPSEEFHNMTMGYNADVEFHNMTMRYNADLDYYIIYASVILPRVYNISKLNYVWQVGYSALGTSPLMHPKTLQNFDSAETINLKSPVGQIVGEHRHHMRMVHGIVNIIGWGTFLPLGVIIARYFKYPLELEGWWYKLHISCQILGFSLGMTGWIIGLWLGCASKYYTFKTHRLYAMFIFPFTALQMFALLLRPGKTDEYRKYWNIYHHFLGYALIAVIIINIFHGIAIFKPDTTAWKVSYIAILATLALTVIIFEVYAWIKFRIKKAKSKPAAKAKSKPAATSIADEPSSPSTEGHDWAEES
ncbi:hypothetical protein K2173_023763 [Erythroxylum novogranatense]|uniref:Cytochrome b561 and DOMON domain-containing protein n=1 Tax=Erythroxylum novogranatense TaxID=1862640 RepID=A0AAV8TJB7_9ROSI|nr:hypothetical protein K2173_023763 [Erythroxylum novogranatense]